ncbi:hypothetical protein AGMMS49975_15720 [Clostridia bacterium]|nr:hypothetical protein AGMMS49975_15720 [Clostridia bacterium]
MTKSEEKIKAILDKLTEPEKERLAYLLQGVGIGLNFQMTANAQDNA